jgi:predicted RNase H-like HicB family nuclease
MNQSFHLQYQVRNGWYVGRLRELPSVISQAHTLDGLVENIEFAFREFFEEDDVEISSECLEKEIKLEV